MKKIIYIMSALLLMTACGEKNGENNGGGGNNEGNGELTAEQKLMGEWHSTTLAITADIYIDFNEDKTFELYQQIGEGAHRLYRGTWNLEGDLLTGRYNNGEDLAAAYQVDISEDMKKLTLTSQNDAAEVSVYEKAEIPEEIKQTCEVIVKSGDCTDPVL